MLCHEGEMHILLLLYPVIQAIRGASKALLCTPPSPTPLKMGHQGQAACWGTPQWSWSIALFAVLRVRYPCCEHLDQCQGGPKWIKCVRGYQNQAFTCKVEIVGEWVLKRRPFWIKILHILPILLGRFCDKKAESCSLCCVACGGYMHGKTCNVFFHCRHCSVQCFDSPSN